MKFALASVSSWADINILHLVALLHDASSVNETQGLIDSLILRKLTIEKCNNNKIYFLTIWVKRGFVKTVATLLVMTAIQMSFVLVNVG
jgi:hypothetical protein